MIGDISQGHTSVAEWSFLLALASFAVALVLSVVRSRQGPSDSHRQPNPTDLALLGLALLALAFLVL